MRVAYLFLAIFSVALMILRNPFVGLLEWEWISFMNPHLLVWGWPEFIPVLEPVAIITLLSWLASREPKAPEKHPLAILLMCYFFWTTVTTIFAVRPESAWEKWVFLLKIIIPTFMAMSMARTQLRINALAWIALLGVGYFGIKGGAYTLMTGGGGRVWGPESSMLGDNNQLAVALLMVAPLALYLRTTVTHKVLRHGLLAAFILILISVIGSASRGALIGIVAMLVWLSFKSRNSVLWLAFGAVFLIGTWQVMPDSWRERMDTIKASDDGTHDQSAQTRLNMWIYSARIANNSPILGGGFNVFFDRGLQERFLPGTERNRAVHSIWFEVLGEHGYVGFALFLMINLSMIFSGGRVKKIVKHRPDLRWCSDLMAMLSVGAVGYAAGGAFVNIATIEIYYAMIALAVATSLYVRRAMQADAVPAGAPVPQPGPVVLAPTLAYRAK